MYFMRASRRLETGVARGDFVVFGQMAVLKPNFFASARRFSGLRTERISPERPISPKTTVFSSIFRAAAAEAMAIQMARSAAESFSFRPPTTLMKMSLSDNFNFVRRSRTAMRRFRRFRSKPLAVRFG